VETDDLFETVLTKTQGDRERCVSTLLKIKDRELRLIKGHLLVEEILYKLLLFKSAKPSAIHKAKLSFAQQLAIIEGLYFDENLMPDWLCPAATKLNKIRNLLAHNLTPKNLEIEIDEFTRIVISNLRKNKSDPTDKLIYSIGNLHCGFMQILATNQELEKLHPAIRSLSLKTQVLAYNSGTSGVLK